MDDTSFRVLKVAAPLRQQVVDGIRRAITTGRFRGGARLIERDLCEMAGVSRTLIREALRQLETEGLVKVIPNKGPIVVVVSPDEAKNVYQVRAELEGLASRLFVENASAPQVASLKQAFGDLKRAYAAGDAEAVGGQALAGGVGAGCGRLCLCGHREPPDRRRRTGIVI